MGMQLEQNIGNAKDPGMNRSEGKGMRRALLGCLLCLGVLCAAQPAAYGAEGAFSYYFPGAFASFGAAMSPDHGLQFVDQALYYHAKITDRAVKNGHVLLSLNATAMFNFFGGSYVPDASVLGGRPQLFAAVPVGYVHNKAGLEVPGLGGGEMTDRAVDIGDSMLMGALYWKTGDFHFKVSEMVFVPTGAYTEGDLANIGRNYWGFDTSCALTWLSSKTGTEVTVMPGLLVNTENTSTDYQTGNELHMDFMVNQFLAKTFALGAQGYYYKQLTGDSGSGAFLGDFKGESYGFGPAMLWMPGSSGRISLVGKWLFDSHHENRMKGDYGQMVVSYKF
jgi:hypothetical protein